jgi:hypothetical protein
MRLRDEVIASYLDDEWRTPPAVHRLLGDRGTVADIVSALERLARAGKIEAKHEAMMVPKFRDKSGPPVLCIDFYRKLQRRIRSMVMKAPDRVADARRARRCSHASA